MNITRFLTARFVPASTDLGLLVLRVWLGASIFWLHGLGKLKNFEATIEGFKAFPWALAAAAILAEGLASIALAIGFGTRWAAALLAATMSVAFFVAHKGILKGEGSGELAFIYLAGFLALLI